MEFTGRAVARSYSRWEWSAGLSILLCSLWIFLTPTVDAADDALASTLATLVESPHASHRLDALRQLEALAENDSLPSEASTALEQSALSDSFVSNRLLATQLLLTHPLEPASRQRLGRMWSGLLNFPPKDPDVWRNMLHPATSQGVRPQTVLLLARLYEPPYPAHVVNAWIQQLRTFGFEESLRLLEQTKARDGFTEEQRILGKQIALRISMQDRRETILKLFARALDASEIEAAVATLQSSRRAADQALAATELQRYFEGSRVPIEISDAALTTLKKSSDRAVQLETAKLVAAGEESVAAREAKLIDAMRVLQNNYSMGPVILSMYDPEETETLVSRLLPDPRTPIGLRMALLAQLIEQANAGRAFDEEIAEALKQGAINTDNYIEISQYRRAYDAIKTRPPLVVWLKSREIQSKAVGLVFIGLLAINGAAGLLTIMLILFRKPVAELSTASRVTRSFAWLGLSVVMLGLMAWAFIGFIGHNSSPAPAASLRMNIPLYIGTIAYLPLMWLLSRRPGT